MTHIRSLPKSAWIAATGALAISAVSPRADACGGFFCSRSPVDQTAEHILFTVNDDQTVTAYVQIKYVGDKDDFAWIVPAPGIPALNTDLPDLALRALDTGTEPQYFKGCIGQANFRAGPAAATGAAEDASHSVTVLASQAVGPFNTVTLEATDADVLVQWLNDHNYRITEKMIPLLQPYVEGGMHFVAVRLQADKAVSDISPMGMTYQGNKPMIPIRLTAAAAQPEMGIVAFILGNRRWAPENYIDLKIPDSLIQFDQNVYGQNNYLTLLSSETDKVGGQAFVTEYAKATTDLAQQIMQQPVPSPDAQKARDALLPILQKFPYITRLHARMSAEEMTDDPTFMVASDRSDVNNIHDLTPPGTTPTCTYNPNPPPTDPCNFNYCGRRGVCVQADGTSAQTGSAATTLPACACANDAIARVTTTGANGQAAMYCEPVAVNLDDSGAEGTLLTAACEGFSCGDHGACVSMNGNPTCQCEGGYAAVAVTSYDPQTGVPSTGITCQAVRGTIPPLPKLPSVGSAMLTPGKTETAGKASGGGCSVAGNQNNGSMFGIAAALGLVLAARRRR